MTITTDVAAPAVDAHDLAAMHGDALDLRSLGEWLTDHLDDLPAGWHSTSKETAFRVYANSAEDFAVLTKWLARGTTIDAPLVKDPDEYTMTVRRDFGRFAIEVVAMRTDVCERVQVGTQPIEVDDPAAPPTPKITVDKPVYEWRCTPVLDTVLDEVAGGVTGDEFAANLAALVTVDEVAS